MLVDIKLNGKSVKAEIASDMTLYDFVREHGCHSVKCGCETSNCGLCTVFLNDKPVLSCSVLAARADKCSVTTLEGLQAEAEDFVTFIADQGAEQCGFCNPGFVMNVLAMTKELEDPTEEEIREEAVQQRKTAESTEEASAIAHSLIENLGLTDDYYWEKYRPLYESPIMVTKGNINVYLNEHSLPPVDSTGVNAVITDKEYFNRLK